MHSPGQTSGHLRVCVPGHRKGPGEVGQLLRAEGGDERHGGVGHAADQGGAEGAQGGHGPGGVREVLLVELVEVAEAGGLDGGDQRGAGQAQGGDGPGGVGEGLGREGVDAAEAGGGEHRQGGVAGRHSNHGGAPKDVGESLRAKLPHAISDQPQQVLPPGQRRHHLRGLLAHLPHPVHRCGQVHLIHARPVGVDHGQDLLRVPC
mmetsp:Transcript_66591/g.177602  ORF Transcript_66591/g.177602 Transcript_66591/m.177602 type:complete len:205 (-) Transcript_66591:46-660(-)